MDFKKILLSLALGISFIGFSQDQELEKYTKTNKGKFFVSWGGNRDFYSNSNIRFKGNDYDFTLYDVDAHDKPKGWHIDYINPMRMTIPQTNAKIGYFISNNYSISIGVDHMKYVMTQNQYAGISGNIQLPDDHTAVIYNGVYTGGAIQLTEDFLIFEHTDGLNYVYIEAARHDDISSFIGIRNTDKIQLNITEGIGFGGLYPRTNATLLQNERHDDFNIAGYGASVTAGLNITFFKHFFIQGSLKGGYINMPNIRTTNNTSDHASQEFFFFQRMLTLGGIFKI